jgi:hypothetical protein
MANFFENRTKSDDTILEARFIKMKLQETATNIDREKRKRMAGFSSSFWNDRTFAVTDSEMEMTQNKVERFVDMRTRESKNGKHPKKSHPVHNRVVMGQYSQLTKELAYGFTEEIKTKLRNIQ